MDRQDNLKNAGTCIDKETILNKIEEFRNNGNCKKVSRSNEDLATEIEVKAKSVIPLSTDAKSVDKKLNEITCQVMRMAGNREEADEIIAPFKAMNAKYIHDFFYFDQNEDGNDGRNVKRIGTKIISWIKNSYNVDISLDEFSSILLELLVGINVDGKDNGKKENAGSASYEPWKIFDKYDAKGSFFSWLSSVAQHEVMRVLRKQGRITTPPTRTKGNTRLLGRSVSPVIWKKVIKDTPVTERHRVILNAVLVMRMTDEKVAKEMNVSIAEFKKLRREAEADLREKLLQNKSRYNDIVLRDKNPVKTTTINITDDYAREFKAWQEKSDDLKPLAEIFGVNSTGEELHKQVVDFLYSFSESLDWTAEEKLVWQLRFIEEIPAKEVGNRVKRDGSWIDRHYSQLNKKFNKAVKEWYDKHH